MDWPTIRPALKTLFQGLSGLPPGQVEWLDEPRNFGDILALMSVSSVVGLGRDEARVTFAAGPGPAPSPGPLPNWQTRSAQTAPTGQELTDTWVGVRRFTLTVKVESDTQTDQTFAYSTLERIRDRLPFKSTVAALNAVNLAFVSAAPTVDLSGPRDGRQWSIATLDIILAARTSTADPAGYGYVATVDMTGNVTP